MRPSGRSATAFTAPSWKRSTCSAALRSSDQRIAEVSKLPESALLAVGRDRERAHRPAMAAQLRVRRGGGQRRRAQEQRGRGQHHRESQHEIRHPRGACRARGCCSRTRVVAQRREERLHRRPVAAALDQQEIVVLGRDRQEAEPVELRHRLDRDAPIGAALRDRGGDRVVRARLVGVAGRPRAREQLVDQHARAGAGIAVDHQAVRIGERGLERVRGAAAFEARVARPDTRSPACAASPSPAQGPGAADARCRRRSPDRPDAPARGRIRRARPPRRRPGCRPRSCAR